MLRVRIHSVVLEWITFGGQDNRFSTTWYQNVTEPEGVVEDEVILEGQEGEGKTICGWLGREGVQRVKGRSLSAGYMPTQWMLAMGEGDGKESNVTYVTTKTRRGGKRAWLARWEGNSAVSWSGKNLAKRKMSEDEIEYGRRKHTAPPSATPHVHL